MSKVNGKLWELGRPLEGDCELQLLGFDTFEGKLVITTFSGVSSLECATAACAFFVHMSPNMDVSVILKLYNKIVF